jgi:signal transduction histidine kinase
MKLIYRIVSRLAVVLFVLMAVWAVAFYAILTAEINDETDDALEEYAGGLIARTLAGETLPSEDNGTNNTYRLTRVTDRHAESLPAVRYSDETMWIVSKMENEPARVLRTIFRDAEGQPFELTVAIPSFEKQDLQARILMWAAILYALMLATVLWVNALIVRRSFRPMYALLDWLRGVTPGEKAPPFEVQTDVTEFGHLSEAVVGAARRAGEMFDEQRIFTGNAAHELQTPVAVCRSRLEILASDPSLTGAQLEQIGAVMGTLDRLAGLNRTLLLLTKIDNHAFADSAEVDVGAVLRRLADDYSEVYAHRGVTVEVCGREPFVLRMNETLAGVLWGNLLKNAFVYSPDGGRVGVHVSADGVTVSNSAAAGPLDPVVIFRRFYRGGGCDEGAGANGLGLALVESICRLYGLRVGYEFVDGRHVFSVGR